MAHSRYPGRLAGPARRPSNVLNTTPGGSEYDVRLYPNGNPGAHSDDGQELIDFDRMRVIPPGEIGSRDGRDPTDPPPQYVDTVGYQRSEYRDPTLHGAVEYMRAAGRGPTEYVGYDNFVPRSSKMPRAAQDEGFLRIGAADPLMTDGNSVLGADLNLGVYRKDLFGDNRAGVLHNEKHPGFAAVQQNIAKKEGVSKDRAGAILASASRKASPAAKKANPRLKKVRG